MILRELIGTVPIIVAGAFLYERRQAIRAKRLRHALIAEIEASQPELTSMMPYGSAFLEGSVYHSNAQKLDLLTNEEIDAVIRFYHRVGALRRIVETKGPEVSPDEIPTHIKNNTESTRDRALEELRENIDESQITLRKKRSGD